MPRKTRSDKGTRGSRRTLDRQGQEIVRNVQATGKLLLTCGCTVKADKKAMRDIVSFHGPRSAIEMRDAASGSHPKHPNLVAATRA